MRALTYQGSKNVKVDTVPDPVIQDPDDIIIQVTATAICGSDLHLFRGNVPGMKEGDILGHEFMGIIVDAGNNVTEVRKGDKVVIPFVIACGNCFFCEHQEFSSCEKTNQDAKPFVSVGTNIKPGAALFGFTHFYGGIPGGQAEYVRVPKANVGPIKIPSTLNDEQVLFLSDILPTGYQAVLNAGIQKGSTVAIFGGGPVGLMSAACAKMLGAEKIFLIDHHQYRLDFAKSAYGIIPINFDDQEDPASIILEQTQRRGVDAVIDAVGFEAKGSTSDDIMTTMKLEESSGACLRQAIGAVRRCGTVSVPGLYAGHINRFTFGDAFDKGITFKMGQTHVQKLMPELLQFIEQGLLKPEIIITHVLPLEQAAHGYSIFDKKEEDCRKVVLKPSLQ